MHPTLSEGGDEGGGWVLSLQPNFQKGEGLTGPSHLEGVGGKEGVTFFREGGLQLTHKK